MKPMLKRWRGFDVSIHKVKIWNAIFLRYRNYLRQSKLLDVKVWRPSLLFPHSKIRAADTQYTHVATPLHAYTVELLNP